MDRSRLSADVQHVVLGVSQHLEHPSRHFGVFGPYPQLTQHWLVVTREALGPGSVLLMSKPEDERQRTEGPQVRG